MRCSCKHCGTYMIQAEDLTLGCICPTCQNRCDACLGTNTVLSKEALQNMKENEMLGELFLYSRSKSTPEEE